MRMRAGACLLVLAMLLCGCGRLSPIHTNTIRLMNFGYEDSRYACLEDAIARYNEKHLGSQLVLEVERYTDDEWDWNAYQAVFQQATEQESVDLILASSDYLGSLADKGYLEPLDEIVKREPFQSEYLAPLLPSLEYDGHYWGLLVETNVQMVFCNIAVLRAAGMSDSNLTVFPEKVRRGEISMQTLLEIAQIGLEQGITEYGIIHRPTPGLFFYLMAQKFGACYFDANGAIYYDKENMIRMLRFFRDISEQNNLQLPTTWMECNDIFLRGDAAIYFDGCWTLQQSNQNSSDSLEKKYIPVLFPAVDLQDSPSTISNSMTIMLAANSNQKDLIKELLVDAYSNWESLGEHAAETFHMPVSQSAVASAEMQENTFLMDNLYMLDLTNFMPNRSDTDLWFQALFNAVRSVENGTGTLEEVADMLILEIEKMQKT